MRIANFNWGHGIFVFYVVFVAAVLTALIASFSVDHTLVVDDYYSEDIAYQSRLDKQTRSHNADNMHITHAAGSDHIAITFDAESTVTGTLQWYRPSAKGLDRHMEISGTQMDISVADMQPGKWTLKMDWQDGASTYYREVDLYL